MVQNILRAHHGYNVKDQIHVLIDETIIETILSISGSKETIHDAIEKMAKELVCQESPTEIGKRIKLLLREDIIYFLKQNKVRLTIFSIICVEVLLMCVRVLYLISVFYI